MMCFVNVIYVLTIVICVCAKAYVEECGSILGTYN